MRFKLKDLIVQILPESDVESDRWGLPPLGDCPDSSCGNTCVFCTDSPSACQLHGSVPVNCYDSDVINPNPLDRLRSLQALKEHLQQHLAAVEAHEIATRESLEPKTLQQVEALEVGLESALEEVRARKARLSRTRSQKSKTAKKTAKRKR